MKPSLDVRSQQQEKVTVAGLSAQPCLEKSDKMVKLVCMVTERKALAGSNTNLEHEYGARSGTADVSSASMRVKSVKAPKRPEQYDFRLIMTTARLTTAPLTTCLLFAKNVDLTVLLHCIVNEFTPSGMFMFKVIVSRTIHHLD
jgi:hypothetical protein